MDYSPSALRRARLRAAHAGVNINFRTGDMTSFRGLRPGGFDLAVNIDSLHLVTSAKARARHLRAAFLLLRSGGLYFLCDHLARRKSSHRGGGSETYFVKQGSKEVRFRAPGLPYLMQTKNGFRREFESAGFDVLNLRAGRSSPIHGPVCILVARKGE